MFAKSSVGGGTCAMPLVKNWKNQLMNDFILWAGAKGGCSSQHVSRSYSKDARAHVYSPWRAALALAATLMLSVFMLYSGAAHAEENYLEPEQAFAFSAAMASPTELDVHYKIAPKYYMYRERFELALSPDASRLGTPQFPAGIVEYDPTFDKKLEIYHDQITIRVPLKPGATTPLKLAVTGQGCAEAGLCYAPMTTELALTPTAQGYSVSGPGVVASVPEPRPEGAHSVAGAAEGGATGLGSVLNMGDVGFASYLVGAGWVKIIVLCLALGLLLSFTPCVLPMVPILLAIVAGDAGRGVHVSRWRGLSLAAAYVLGMSLVYTVLGVVAGLIGASLSVWLQTPWVLTLFAVLLGLLALAMFGVFTLQVPSSLQSALNDRLSKIPGGRYSGAFLMGMVSALIVGPCIAAPLAGVLLFISQTGNLVLGGLALFALAWGEGLLLLVVGASSGALLPRAGAWMEGVNRFFGLLLFATAWWMVNSIVPAWLAILGWAFLGLWSAVMLRAFEALPAEPGLGDFLRKTLGLLLALWMALLIISVAAGGRSLLQPLGVFRVVGQAGGSAAPAGSLAAANAGPGLPAANTNAMRARFTQVASVAELDKLLASTDRPVMLDFYADWCVSCIEMEKLTFSDPVVAKKMSQFLLVQADVTKNTDDDRALLKRFKLFGPPGIMFFDSRGRLLPDARVIGFKNAGQFGAVLDRVLAAQAKR
ncbi:thiol:disulfide interchange protein DsbD [Paralcaligenes ureilyticus]|uniref:Thiol:disulfide interchange protein DsbD n=2 Tax=Paralcaligenes ureilyticus TaxID=627131 RepID=A0A4R3M2Q4_9BURK|nr:thiol:disulfide interchange protein DsbD [Paralcaligenes ureilyticus]